MVAIRTRSAYSPAFGLMMGFCWLNEFFCNFLFDYYNLQLITVNEGALK